MPTTDKGTAHRHKDSRGKWVTDELPHTHVFADTPHPADSLTFDEVAKVKLLIAAGGGGGTTPIPNPPVDPPPVGPDITAPVISGLTIVVTGTTTTDVSCATNEASTVVFEYGLTTTYGTQTSATASGTAHAKSLTGLTPNTTYQLRARATDTAGNLALSSNRSFTTQNTSPPTPTPSSLIYGPGVGYETKSNERLDGNKQAFRFRATGGTVTQIAVNVRTGTGYSLGTGGTIKASLQTDNAGTPSGTILGSVTWSPGNPGTAENKDQHACAATLVAGTVYHLVTENTDGSPTANYVSINQVLAWNPADTPRQPAFSDDFAVLRRTSSWGLQNGYIPVFDIEYSSGAHDGSMYFAVILGNYALIGGTSNMARCRWTQSSTQTFDAANVQVRRLSGSGDLVVRLEQGNGTLIESVSIPASSIAVISADPGVPGGTGANAELSHVEWTRVPFVTPRTLTSGQTYNLRLSCAAGTQYSVTPIRWADDDMGAWDGYHFRDGAGLANGSSGQKTTDGSTWVDLYAFSSVDIAFYLEVA